MKLISFKLILKDQQMFFVKIQFPNDTELAVQFSCWPSLTRPLPLQVREVLCVTYHLWAELPNGRGDVPLSEP